MKNRQFVLKQRPEGLPKPADFELVESTIPDLSDNQLLVRNIYVSVDPGMRTRLNKENSYSDALELGELIESGFVGQVIKSKNSKYSEGDFVAGGAGWQEYTVSNGRGLITVHPNDVPISTAIGVLGVSGLTGYFGVKTIGKAKKGETILVSSAAGAVGSVAGQVARLLGLQVVGLAGSDAKCSYLTDELGFDAAINYKTGGLADSISVACPEGIDIYFDNVGGEILNTAVNQMRTGGRVVISGQTAHYNCAPQDRVGLTATVNFITHRLIMQGFVVYDYAAQFRDATKEMKDWITSGELKYHEQIHGEFESLPKVLIDIFEGVGYGRQIVQLITDPTCPERVL